MRNNLRVVMAEQRKNIKDLKKATGISRTTLSDMYNEKGNCKISTLMALCDALNVTPNDILIRKKKASLATTSKTGYLENY